MKHRSRGQALAEFALIAPLFFLLLFGIIEAGRFIFYYEVLNNATREGARYAIVNGDNSLDCPTGPAATASKACDTTGEDVVQKVRASAIGVLGTSVAVDRCWWYTACDFSTHGDGDNARSATVTVAASYTYSALVPLVPLPNITVTAESSLVINN
jgi:Flp pilus assembly protein TadG